MKDKSREKTGNEAKQDPHKNTLLSTDILATHFVNAGPWRERAAFTKKEIPCIRIAPINLALIIDKKIAPPLAQEIVEDLEAALEQFREIAVDLSGGEIESDGGS